MNTKICSKCKKLLPITEFYKHKSCKFGVDSICKKCNNQNCKIYRQENRGELLKRSRIKWQENKVRYNKQRKMFRKNHKELIKKQKHSYYIKHKIKIKNKHQKYYHKNKDKILLQCKIYFQKNKSKINEQIKLKLKTDVNFRIAFYLRNRLREAIKENTKSNHTIELLGCKVEFLRSYLEKKFKKGMTWRNHGNGWNGKGLQEWNIDHIKPCAKFDLSKPSEQRKCFHYTNLQPLWADENRKKGSK